jgi:MerR family transcriptional regulator, light-induced transcriptional regulator
MTADASALLRIGELSRRVGVSEHLLRIWERRYGLLKPARSPGGFRLYSEADADRVRRMQAYLTRGLSAAEAARAVLSADDVAVRLRAAPRDRERRAGLSDTTADLAQALDELDEPSAQATLDRLLADFTVETVLRDVLMPYLHELGVRWQQGIISVAQEHFASNVVRGRLTSLARGWGEGNGPLAILACPPEELHDLALLVFGIVLNRNGWRVGYLGVSTPLDDVMSTATEMHPDLVVLAATTPERFARHAEQLSQLARIAPLALAGEGATRHLADAVGARLLGGDAVTEAQRL